MSRRPKQKEEPSTIKPIVLPILKKGWIKTMNEVHRWSNKVDYWRKKRENKGKKYGDGAIEHPSPKPCCCCGKIHPKKD